MLSGDSSPLCDLSSFALGFASSLSILNRNSLCSAWTVLLRNRLFCHFPSFALFFFSCISPHPRRRVSISAHIGGLKSFHRVDIFFPSEYSSPTFFLTLHIQTLSWAMKQNLRDSSYMMTSLEKKLRLSSWIHLLWEEAKWSAREAEKKSMKTRSIQLASPLLCVLFSLPNHSYGTFVWLGFLFVCGGFCSFFLYI